MKRKQFSEEQIIAVLKEATAQPSMGWVNLRGLRVAAVWGVQIYRDRASHWGQSQEPSGLRQARWVRRGGRRGPLGVRVPAWPMKRTRPARASSRPPVGS